MNVVGVVSKVSSCVEEIVVKGWKYVWEEHKVAFLTTVVVVSAVKIHRFSKRKKLRNKWNSIGENVVVLHTIGIAKTVPNLSPFILKLETYLRMAGIKYVLDTEQPFGSKGKTPWITLNGQDYTDSQLIIEFLGKKFNKNFSANLNPEQKAAARALLIMNDEHFLWGLAWWRLIKDPESRVIDLGGFPEIMKVVKPLLISRTRKSLWAQGLGRHSDAEIESISRKDIEALSLYLGNKPFLMGETPCEVDCAVFGTMAQCVWALPGAPFEAMLINDYNNLLQYCIRMKEKFWPDWEKHLLVSK